MKKLAIIMSVFLSGCAMQKNVYKPGADDVELKAFSSEYSASKGIRFINERRSEVDVYYADKGCPTFKHSDKGYIGSIEINNLEKKSDTLKIPNGKNIFLVTKDTWTGVGYFCGQAYIFTTNKNDYTIDLKGIQRSFSNKCIPHILKEENSKQKNHIISIPMTRDVIGPRLGVDIEQCEIIVADK